jgi:hypothetical protein
VTPKSIKVFYPIWTIILWSLNIVSQMELKLCSRNFFQFLSKKLPWLLTPKLLGSSTKYGQRSYEVWTLWAKWNLRYAPETVFSLKVKVTLTFDLVAPKSIRVLWPNKDNHFKPFLVTQGLKKCPNVALNCLEIVLLCETVVLSCRNFVSPCPNESLVCLNSVI